MRRLAFLILTLAFVANAAQEFRLIRPAEYRGMRDASAGIVVSSNLFIAADDENNTLRLYSSEHPGPPVKEFNLDAFLEVTGKSPEADLEGAARIGNRAYWIGSHGRNKAGKERSNRCRFFATDIKMIEGEVFLTPVGKPGKRLLEDLIHDPQFDQFHFAEAATRAPKEQGALNIEGLSATPDGHLLIGFRNPIPAGNALLIPMLNPDEIIKGAAPRFGPAIQLDLAGLGIRDMAWQGSAYFIIAGSWHSGGKSRFYRWPGPGAQPEPLTVKHLADYNPEAILFYPERGTHEIQILSDDGNRIIDGVTGKQAGDSRPRTFRSFWLQER